MESLELISQNGMLTEYRVKKSFRVSELIHELNLEQKFYAIMVNGKKSTPDTIIEPESSVVILPKIAGG